ncbi:MAG: PQQ-binding-like beta-propeller repeat protein [Nocardioidaceae bacterium]
MGTKRINAVVAAVAAAGLVLVPATASGAGTSTPPGSDWLAYGRNAGHTSASFGDPAITTSNAGSLSAKWHFTPGTSFDASPTVAAGRVFIGGRNAVVYALDAKTGALLWQRQLDKGSRTYCPAKGIVGTATVAPDPVTGVSTVYTPGAHFLYALNAATGAVVWKTAIGPVAGSSWVWRPTASPG